MVIDTGGSTVSVGAAYGIVAMYGATILVNTVNGVAPAGTNVSAYGIHTTYNGNIIGNRVRGLAPTGSGAPYGIHTNHLQRAVIRDNDVQGPGPGVVGGIGVRCHDSTGTSHGNVIAGFETGTLNCLSSSDVVNPN